MTMSVDNHILEIEKMISTIEKDIRDEWPSKNASYIKGESICHGTFGIVRYAEAHDAVFGLEGLESRNCVIKTIYLRHRFDAILLPKPQESGNSSVIEGTDSEEIKQKRLLRLYRRFTMELFILNRCRHANIMHSHAVFLADGDLHIVLPRLYVLGQLIEMYRDRKQAEPVPVNIIAKIIRQLCQALDFLQRAGIIHRDINPENIFLTRDGTVKLGHFSQARALFPKKGSVRNNGYKTPVGREEYMCFEKLNNIYNAKNIEDCLLYSFSADIWSLGVLILTMVSYFPNEPHHKLSREFALAMHHERIPFIWFTVDMLQLRSRLVKSGGEELKLFLSDHLLTVSPNRRATASSLLQTPEMKRWCLKTVEEDSQYIRQYFINEVDFANHSKLESDLPNYNSLESKDIPAEFYWDDTWKELEKMEFILCFNYPDLFLPRPITYRIRFSTPSPLFRPLHTEIDEGRIELTNLIPLDYGIKAAIYELIEKKRKLSEHGEEKGLFAAKAPSSIKKCFQLSKSLSDIGMSQKQLNGEQLEVVISFSDSAI